MSNEEPIQAFLPHFIVNDGSVTATTTMNTSQISQGRPQVYTLINPTSNGQWVLNGVTIQPTTIIREISHQPQQHHQMTTTDVSQILPDMPLPQAVVQSLVTSSTTADTNMQKNASAQSATAGGKMRVGGSNPCAAPIVSMSMKELRLKGTNFLRTHASKHGIPNASRKLTTQVTIELADHYEQVHGVAMARDDPKESSHPAHRAAIAAVASLAPRRRSGGKKSASAAVTVPVSIITQPLLPQQPLPVGVMQQLKQLDGQQINSHNQQQQQPQQQRVISDKEYLLQRQQQQQQQQQIQPNDPNQVCKADILVKTRSELSACGTSMLRPEAAAHKVHNSSRKPKDVVVEELWQHYLTYHSKELIVDVGNVGAWIGTVVDEEENRN